jgi:hypothetical protein
VKGNFEKIDWIGVTALGSINQQVVKNIVNSYFDYTIERGLSIAGTNRKSYDEAFDEFKARIVADIIFSRSSSQEWNKKMSENILKKTFIEVMKERKGHDKK